MSVKIVHCADLHIGAAITYLPGKAALLRADEVRTAFLRIINFCKEKAADALIISGDLFDTPTPTDADCDFVKNALASLFPTDVYISAGNHDYITASSPFSRQDYFSENVHIFPTFEHAFELHGKNTLIWGRSYNAPLIEPSFNSGTFDNDKIHIFCLHGDLTNGSDYNIISSDRLASLPCNYAAFGHIHHGKLFSAGNVKCGYSGTPEGHYLGDDGFTGFIYAEISKDETRLSQISLSQRYSKSILVDVTGMKTEEIIDTVRTKINDKDLFRITLGGEYKSPDDINLPKIKEELQKTAFYIDVFDETFPGYDFEELEREESLRGAFLRELRLITNSEEEFLLSAKAGLDALAGKIPDTGGELC